MARWGRIGAGVAYAGAEIWTLDDENKKLVTAITTGDVKGIVAAQMKNQEGRIQEVTSGIWSTLKIAALVVLGIMCIRFSSPAQTPRKSTLYAGKQKMENLRKLWANLSKRGKIVAGFAAFIVVVAVVELFTGCSNVEVVKTWSF